VIAENQSAAADRNFYIAGGTLRADAPSYVPRRADQDLFDALSRGEFCYVLTSRQMGKSSLMVRTAARLREAGAHVAILDLTALGENVSAEQWYEGLLELLGHRLDLADELEEFWLEHERVAPLRRWMRALREVVLPNLDARCSMLNDGETSPKPPPTAGPGSASSIEHRASSIPAW
jgi:hypothetical protein